jgi:hypothetical protein
MRISLHLAVILALIPGARAAAQQTRAQGRPVVAELFTSQGCSSCPPAEALLTMLARTRPDILPLEFHITYWNTLGWRDPFSFRAATQRQQTYAALLGEHSVYTPEMVVDGAQALVGSRRGEVEAAIQRAEDRQVTAASMRVSRSQGGDLTVVVGPGIGKGTVLLVGFDPEHRTAIGRGENGGRLLLESNIVRSIQAVGRWTGAPLRLQQPVPAGTQFVALLQAPDGRIIGAARLVSPKT